MGIESLWRSYLDKRKSRPVEAYDFINGDGDYQADVRGSPGHRVTRQ